VSVSLAITIAGLLIAAGVDTEAFGSLLFTTTLLTMVTRVAAWYAIVRCRRNTSSPVFTALALLAVALDMLFGVVKWPPILFATLMS
jgi:hypothetical protein